MLAKSCKKIFVVQKSKFFSTVTSFWRHFFAKSAVKTQKSKCFIFVQKSPKMTSQWRQINFLTLFLRFLSNFTTCVKISAHLEHFYEKSILSDFSRKMTIFLPKWRHNDVTPIFFSIFDLQFFFHNSWENFSHIEAFFRKLEGGVNIAPPPQSKWGS